LAELPLEIQEAILSDLDIKTLYTLRKTSRATRFMVQSLRYYDTVVRLAPELLRAVLSTQADEFTTIKGLHSALTTLRCSSCSYFGVFYSLSTCERVCVICLMLEPHFLPIQQSFLRQDSSLRFSTRQLSTVRSIHSLPGTYSPERKTLRRRQRHVDRRGVISSGLERLGSHWTLARLLSRGNGNRESHLMRDLWLDRDTGAELRTVDRTLLPAVLQARTPPNPEQVLEIFMHQSLWGDRWGLDYRRFMGVVRIPWFDQQTLRLERGLGCRPCGILSIYGNDRLKSELGNSSTSSRIRWPWRTYPEAGYFEHFEACEKAQQLFGELMSKSGDE